MKCNMSHLACGLYFLVNYYLQALLYLKPALPTHLAFSALLKTFGNTTCKIQKVKLSLNSSLVNHFPLKYQKLPTKVQLTSYYAIVNGQKADNAILNKTS